MGVYLRHASSLEHDPREHGVVATLTALGGVGEAESIAPDPILTSRAAAQFERYWRL